MLTLVLQKIISNTWKVLCLLLGSILVVGMVCSIPIYSNGILQRLLTKDLEQAQADGKRYPGYVVFESNYNNTNKQTAEKTRDSLRSEFNRLITGMPVEPEVTLESLQLSYLFYRRESPEGELLQNFSVYALSDFNARIKVTAGRYYEPVRSDGVIEAVVTDAAMKNLNLLLDREYDIYSYRQKKDEPLLFRVKIVGIIAASDNTDLYWFQHINSFSQSILIDPADLQRLVQDVPKVSMGEHQLITAFNYYNFRIQDIEKYKQVTELGTEVNDKYSSTTNFAATFSGVIDRYVVREAELKLMLQILIIPILLMLVFYIFMVSQLMVSSEQSIISVLESRGAGRKQILLLYGLESLVYGLITLVAGPVLGLWMVRVIGASNGFLEFVSRKALNVALDRQALLYGLAAVVLFLLTTLLPVFIQARTSIVQQKRKKSHSSRAPFWQRLFLDVILLAVSLYAIYRLRSQMAIQQATGIAGTEMDLDFLLFLSSTFFILGAGRLFLRLYPLLVRLVYRVGRRFWNPALYASFHQISRSNGQEQFLMIFLILALSIGLFNANAARTINRNTEDSIRCQVGADIKVQEYWQKYDQNGMPIAEDIGFGLNMGQGDTSTQKVIKYFEPDFSKYSSLKGVETAARVFRSSDSTITKGSSRSGPISLMAVDPYDFARTAWNRTDLFRYHINEYMNVMMAMPNAVIVSSNLKEELDLNVGDGIIYTVNNTDRIDGVIIAFVDYWPGYQPLKVAANGQLQKQSLVVSSLEFMLSKTALQPYEVWLRRTPGTTDKVIYEAIEAGKIDVTTIESANQQITSAKNDPQLQGTNGALTLGFIVSMLICAVGFLIYWIMSVQGRVLQFGIFRAMGLSKGSVLGMLVSEQVLVSGAAVLAGILIGGLTSLLFVPLFQLVYSSANQPIPFRVISVPADSLKVYVVLGVLLLLCFAVLTRLILRIRIDQAVKLGED